MKRIIAVLLAMVMVLSMVGCNSATNVDGTHETTMADNSTNESTDNLTIATDESCGEVTNDGNEDSTENDRSEEDNTENSTEDTANNSTESDEHNSTESDENNSTAADEENTKEDNKTTEEDETNAPTTSQPTTSQPTTGAPVEKPTERPTEAPTQRPTEAPTERPTEEPTEAPTQKPTERPTEAPTEEPTEERPKPTDAPTQEATRPTESGHKHNYIVTQTKQADCLTKGYDYCVCECGDWKYDRYTDPLGHIVGEGVVTLEPTDYETGFMAYNCERCDITVELVELPALSHTHNYVLIDRKAQTCTTDGYETYQCSICNVTKTDTLEMHKFICTGTEMATCARPTHTYFKCEWCGYEKVNTYPPSDHHITITVVEPTCLNDGKTIKKCNVCGLREEYDIVKGTHKWGEWEIVSEPCIVFGDKMDGLKVRYCQLCTESETAVIPYE